MMRTDSSITTPLNEIRRPLLRVFLFLVGTFIAWPYLFWGGQVPLNGEVLRFVYPNWSFIHNAFIAHRLPLWNPYRSFGEPFWTDPRSMTAYLPTWFFAGLDYLNFSRCWILFHSLIAGGFAAAWAFEETGDETAACAALALASLNGFYCAHAPYPNQFATASYLPSLFYFLKRRSVLGLTLMLTLQWTAGYPPFFYLSLITLIALAIYNGPDEVSVTAKAMVAAAGCSAVQWIPFLEFLIHSDRQLLLSNAVATEFSITPTLLVKEFFAPQWIWFRPFVSGDPAVMLFYVGLIALALSILAGLKMERGVRFWTILCATSALASLGDFWKIYKWIPFFHLFRFPAGWLLLTAAAITYLAPRGLAGISSRRIKLLLVIGLWIDLLAWNVCPKVAWISSVFFSTPPPLVKLLKQLPFPARIYHPDLVFDVVLNDAPRRDLQSLIALKENLVPSSAMAFDISDTNSYQIWHLSRTQRYLTRLTQEGPRSPLLPLSGISTVITVEKNAKEFSKAFHVVPLPLPRPLFYLTSNPTQPLSRFRYTPGHLAASVHTTQADTFVFSEADAPGWTAAVDHQIVKIKPYESEFISVDVPTGNHDIELNYNPVSLKVGAVVTLFSFIALFYLCRRQRTAGDIPEF